MTTQKIQDDTLFSEIHSLVTACLEGVATSAMVKRLDELVSDNQETRRLYLQYLRDSIGLRYIVRPSSRETVETITSITDRTGISAIQPVISFAQVPSRAPGFPSTTTYSPLSYLSSGWPVAYLIATVIFGIGALIGTVTYVSRPVQVAKRLPENVNGKVMPDPQREYVGRITGMVDCRWADSSITPVLGRVSSGQKLDLSSGLMEITYNTGANVILQGPVTYEIASKNSGFLSIGKLTGKVEGEEAKGFSVMNDGSSAPENGSMPRSRRCPVPSPPATTSSRSMNFGRWEIFRMKA